VRFDAARRPVGAFGRERRERQRQSEAAHLLVEHHQRRELAELQRPADRLAAIEAFDFSGPVAINARATGTLADPRITGTMVSDNLTLTSGLTGTRVEKGVARGRFVGSRLELVRFSGATAGGGTISGSGTVDRKSVV
jgi:autotransporter translocation and assembly factor TamB